MHQSAQTNQSHVNVPFQSFTQFFEYTCIYMPTLAIVSSCCVSIAKLQKAAKSKYK